ncbi:hypothetical protein IQ07DRAFT_679312 [Pyrenochaeta sp. DS3sAY3a]|nr:hypothetical protein IQ07DRAFT_679312 [Pyrenochaeta sp. DS3sAY3a]
MMMSFSKTTSYLKSDDRRPFSSDISYNLRYYEPHGRNQSDPWSQRQSTIHQKFYFEPAHSNWIIIHPPVLLRGSLQDAQLLPSSHPMSFHIRYIRASMHFWRDYLNYRGSELLDLDFKVSVQKSLAEYMIDMSEIQKVQLNRKKLYLALPILDGLLEVIIGLRKQAELIRDALALDICICKAFEDELDHISTQIGNYKSSMQSLIKIADGIYFTTHNVLLFHTQDLSIRNGASIAQSSLSSLSENRLITATTDKTYRDSRTMRIATVVAMLYLPANLVMSFFSTGLVNFYTSEGTATADSAIKMRIYGQVWIVVVTSLVLAATTMTTVAVWDHRGRR